MLNMHTNYLACETCHLKKNEGETVVYKWYSPVEKNPKGPFFGTAYDPETGELEMVNDHFAKIAPFYEKNGNLTSTVQMQDAPLAMDFVKIRDQLTPEQRKDVTKRFHVDILAKGPDCQTCHSTKGILDFKALGFSPKRTVDIEELNIKASSPNMMSSIFPICSKRTCSRKETPSRAMKRHFEITSKI